MFIVPERNKKPEFGRFWLDRQHRLYPSVGLWLMDNEHHLRNVVPSGSPDPVTAANSPPTKLYMNDGYALDFTHNSNQYFNTGISDSLLANTDYTMSVIWTPTRAAEANAEARAIIGFNTKGQLLWDHSGNEEASFAWNSGGWRFLPWTQSVGERAMITIACGDSNGPIIYKNESRVGSRSNGVNNENGNTFHIGALAANPGNGSVGGIIEVVYLTTGKLNDTAVACLYDDLFCGEYSFIMRTPLVFPAAEGVPIINAAYNISTSEAFSILNSIETNQDYPAQHVDSANFDTTLDAPVQYAITDVYSGVFDAELDLGEVEYQVASVESGNFDSNREFGVEYQIDSVETGNFDGVLDLGDVEYTVSSVEKSEFNRTFDAVGLANFANQEAYATEGMVGLFGVLSFSMASQFVSEVIGEFVGGYNAADIHQFIIDSALEAQRAYDASSADSVTFQSGIELLAGYQFNLQSFVQTDGTVVQEGAIVTPDERTLKVKFDDRRLRIEFDDRRLKI